MAAAASEEAAALAEAASEAAASEEDARSEVEDLAEVDLAEAGRSSVALHRLCVHRCRSRARGHRFRRRLLHRFSVEGIGRWEVADDLSRIFRICHRESATGLSPTAPLREDCRTPADLSVAMGHWKATDLSPVMCPAFRDDR